MNLQVLRPSRKRPKPGDVFTMKVADSRYLFGRVIASDVVAGGFPGAILIYIYRTSSTAAKAPMASELTLDNLLISPAMTNTLPWSRGYFETLENRPLESGEVLSEHCFRSSTGKYFDECSNELPGPVEPCGDWGLQSYRTIDDEVSDALGIAKSQA